MKNSKHPSELVRYIAVERFAAPAIAMAALAEAGASRATDQTVCLQAVEFRAYCSQSPDLETIADYLSISLKGYCKKFGRSICPSCNSGEVQGSGVAAALEDIKHETGVVLLTEVLDDSASGLSFEEILDFWGVNGLVCGGRLYRGAEGAREACPDLEDPCREVVRESVSITLSEENRRQLIAAAAGYEGRFRLWRFAKRDDPGQLLYDSNAAYVCEECGAGFSSPVAATIVSAAGEAFDLETLSSLPVSKLAEILRFAAAGSSDLVLSLDSFSTFGLGHLPVTFPLRQLSTSETLHLQLYCLVESALQDCSLYLPDAGSDWDSREGRDLQQMLEHVASSMQARVFIPGQLQASANDAVLQERLEKLCETWTAKRSLNRQRSSCTVVLDTKLWDTALDLSGGEITVVSGAPASGKSLLLDCIKKASQGAFKKVSVVHPEVSVSKKTLVELFHFYDRLAPLAAQTESCRRKGLSSDQLLDLLRQQDDALADIFVRNVSLAELTELPVADLFELLWEFEGVGDTLGMLLALGCGPLSLQDRLSDLVPAAVAASKLVEFASYVLWAGGQPERRAKSQLLLVDHLFYGSCDTARAVILNVLRDLAAAGVCVVLATNEQFFAKNSSAVIRMQPRKADGRFAFSVQEYF